MCYVNTLAAALERWAPRPTAADFDNVGLLVGNPRGSVTNVLVALDLTPAVVSEAEMLGAEMIVTHHPLLFKPLKRVVPDDPAGALVTRLIQSDIAYYAAHTNLDAAHDGVSFALAEQLGIEEPRFLVPQRDQFVKFVTFAPEPISYRIRDVLAWHGGRIGEYDHCAFVSEGTGFFRPSERANPAYGNGGGHVDTAEEVRIEAIVPRWSVENVIAGVKGVHPYEEVAYDVYPLENPATRTGYGAIGKLPAPLPLRDFLAVVRARLNADALRYAGRDDAKISTVAVCGGSGSRFLADARRAQADAYVTADVTYHTFFEVLGAEGRPTMALIDAGHYETERITEQILADYIAQKFSDVTVHRTESWTSPMKTFSA